MHHLYTFIQIFIDKYCFECREPGVGPVFYGLPYLNDMNSYIIRTIPPLYIPSLLPILEIWHSLVYVLPLASIEYLSSIEDIFDPPPLIHRKDRQPI